MDVHRPTLQGARVRLRPFNTSDEAAIRALPLDVEAMRMFGVDAVGPRQRSAKEAHIEYQKLAKDPVAWAIDAGAGYIGHIKLRDLHAGDRRARLAIWIEDASRRSQGFGTAALHTLLGHAFGPLGLHRIGVRVLDINHRAIRAYEKCGFVHEGLERETALLDGRWHDDIMLGLLDREFQPDLSV